MFFEINNFVLNIYIFFYMTLLFFPLPDEKQAISILLGEIILENILTFEQS